MFRSPRCVARFVIRIFLSPFLFIFLLNSSVAQAAPPTPSLSAPSTGYVNEVILVDGRRSTGVLNKPQTNGSPSVTIDFGDGFSANLLASGHAYRAPGTYTITLTVKSSTGETASDQRTIVVSTIPAASGSAVQVLTDQGNAVTNATALQTAINLAATRNTVEQEIVLPAGAVFAGQIILPTPVGGKYITIRSASLASLPAGNRVSPGNGSLMPVITAPSSTNLAAAAISTVSPAPATAPHHYRFQGIHLRKDDETKRSATLMNIGTDISGGGQNTLAKTPHHFIVERCWFDGGASDSSELTNGLRIYASAVSVLDSYMGDFRLIGLGVDTAAISVTMGQGPYAFNNNTMVATSENFSMAGGSAETNSGTVSNATTSSCTLSSVTNLELDQNLALKVGGSYGPAQSTVVRSISGNNITFDPIPTAPDNGSVAEWIVVPSYVEFRGNYLYKPLKWWPKHPTWNGITYQIKNFWEAKFGRYVVVDGNVMENSWIADQFYAIALSVRNGNGGFSAAAVVREMQWSNNLIRNAGAGINLLGSDYAGPTQITTDITFRNNLFQNVGVNFDSTGAGHMLINMQNGATRMRRIFMIHNTHDNGTPDNSYGMITDFGESGGADESMWLNNVHQHGGYGFRSNSSIVDMEGNIRRFLPPGGPTVWNRNLVANIGAATYPPRPRGVYPEGEWAAMFVDYRNGDFTLKPSNPGKGAAADGTDMGVNMETLRAATLHSKDGQNSDAPAAPASTTPATRPRLAKPQ